MKPATKTEERWDIKSQLQELERQRKKLLEQINQYQKLPYYTQFVPGLQNQLAALNTRISRASMVEASASNEKNIAGSTILAAVQPLETGLPKLSKPKGVIVQRIGPIRMADSNNKTIGFTDLALSAFKSPNGQVMRKAYINTRLFVDGKPHVCNGTIGLADLAAFVDNILRWGPLTTRPGTKLKLHYPELWELHGNHKLKWQRPYTDKFEKQARRKT